ncbi:MAG: PEP-CTERM sorting domain-containing protein [Colwellia sp.]|nr:PEP-CTERM sorting domain-containing protein [Colwellia sp.]
MKTIKSLLLASFFFGFLSIANATLVTQELLSFDGVNETVIGSLQVDTNDGDLFGSNVVFSEGSIFTLTLNGFDIPAVWDVVYLEAALDLSDLFAGFNSIDFDLYNFIGDENFAYYADYSKSSWDHSTYFDISGITAFSETRLGNVSVVPEPAVALILLLGLALISVKRKSF